MKEKRRVPELQYRSSRIFRVLGNPTAYQIMKFLSKKSMKPTSIASQLKLSVPTVSVVLRHLRELDLVRYENRVNGKLYFIKDMTIVSVMDSVELLVKRIRTQDY